MGPEQKILYQASGGINKQLDTWENQYRRSHKNGFAEMELDRIHCSSSGDSNLLEKMSDWGS